MPTLNILQIIKLRKRFYHNISYVAEVGNKLPLKLGSKNSTEVVDSAVYLFIVQTIDRLNASGGREAAVTARVRIGWVRFRECGELLLGNRFPLKMKGKVYRCCVRSAILYGSETWCLKENEKAILRRTERAMVRAMYGQKVVDRKTTAEQMNMLGLKETIDQLATANGIRWYGHVLRRDDDSVLRVALDLEVSGKRKRGRPKKTWKKQVEEETEKIGLKKKDALIRDKWTECEQLQKKWGKSGHLC